MLPKIEQPHYKTTLPISGKTVTYRPYLMKEQKIILLATNSDDPEDMVTSITQIINNCTENELNVPELNSVDIAYLMIKIRSASEGDIVDINMKCKNKPDGENVCGHSTPMELNFSEMKLSGDYDKDNSKIELTDTIGMQLKIPGIEMLAMIEDKDTSVADIIPSVIDYIYDEEGIHRLDNEPQEEIEEFVNSLSTKNIKDITDFFQQIPKIKVDVDFTCEKCGYSEVVSVEDLNSFLA